jgi:glucose/arabinose dehydrogenase
MTHGTGNERKTGTSKAPMLDSWLAYMYAPMMPILRKISISREARRGHSPQDILVPAGYTAEVVATGLNAPVHCCFNPDEPDYVYVSECGHKIESKPRIVKVDVRTGAQETFFDLPDERWQKTGAFTGACWHQGQLYFMNTSTGTDARGALSRLRADGTIEDLVTGLPWGDHQPNYPVVGPDGKVYWGQGTATNTGIVGADDFAYEWLRDFPDWHDVPGQDVVLAGRNYEDQNVLGNVTETVRTGAFVPFGTETYPGQVIKGDVKCSGAVLRCNPDGSDLELVAWGLRNPYGIAFHPDGRLFATNLYARAGIPEAWLVDVEAGAVEVFRSPEGGRYREHSVYRRGEVVESPAVPGLRVPVEHVLG